MEMKGKTMGHIFCLMGKSSSGKDTVYQRLLADETLGLQRLVTGTTRPIREGERDGVEYHFYTDQELAGLRDAGRIIECRSYDTAHGIWNYFTVADDTLLSSDADHLAIYTLEAYLSLREYFGQERLIPLYLEVDAGLRLERALRREQAQKEPKYREMCRRFLADEEDFSAEKLEAAGIRTVFENVVLEDTVRRVAEYIRSIKDR